MAVIVPPHFPPASKPLATMTDQDWSNIATFHGSKHAIYGSVDIWDFRRSEICGGSAVQAGEQHEVEAGAYENTDHIDRKRIMDISAISGCDLSDILEYYARVIRPRDIIVAVNAEVVFIDALRLFDFVENVRNPFHSDDKSTLWLGHEADHDEMMHDPQAFFGNRGKTQAYVPLESNDLESDDPMAEEGGHILAVRGEDAGFLSLVLRNVTSSEFPPANPIKAVSTELSTLGKSTVVDMGLTYTTNHDYTTDPLRPEIHQIQNRDGNPSMIYDADRSKPAVFWSIFAGRKSIMKNIIPSLLEALDTELVDEVHLWDFICKKGNFPDRVWLHELMKENDKIFLSTPTDCLWGDFYNTYGTLMKDDDVVFKVDDDIIYADMSRLDGFVDLIRAKPEVYLWSANVVNNGKSAVFQRWNGVYDDVGEDWVKDITLDKEIGNWRQMGIEFTRQDIGFGIHKHFLYHPDKFFKVDEEKPFLYWCKMRISINFLGWSGKNAKKIHKYGTMPDDEYSLTYVAAVANHETLMMYMPFVVSHASFGPQHMGEVIAHMYENFIENVGPIINYDDWHLGDPHEVELPTTPVPNV